MKQLKDNIREEIAAIPAEMLAKTMENAAKSAQNAINARGGHLRDIIFKNLCKQIYLEQIKWLRLPTGKFLFFSLKKKKKKHWSFEYGQPCTFPYINNDSATVPETIDSDLSAVSSVSDVIVVVENVVTDKAIEINNTVCKNFVN